MSDQAKRSFTGAAGRLALAVLSACLVGPWRSAAQPPPAEPPGPETVTVKGTVLGPDGQPVPGAEVGVIHPVLGGRPLDGLFHTKSGETGRFEAVTADLPSHLGPRLSIWVLARSGDGGHLAKPVQITLQPSAYIEASVLDPQDGPVPDIGTVVVVRDAYPPGSVADPRTDGLGEMLIGPLPAGLPLGILVARESRHLVPEHVWDRNAITLQPGETRELPPLTLHPAGRSVEAAQCRPTDR